MCLATADGRGLVAIGCAEGVWIGFRHDSRCTCTGILLDAFFVLITLYSNAPSFTSENGNTVCNVGGLRYIPGTGRQGMFHAVAINFLNTTDLSSYSHYLRIT